MVDRGVSNRPESARKAGSCGHGKESAVWRQPGGRRAGPSTHACGLAPVATSTIAELQAFVQGPARLGSGRGTSQLHPRWPWAAMAAIALHKPALSTSAAPPIDLQRIEARQPTVPDARPRASLMRRWWLPCAHHASICNMAVSKASHRLRNRGDIYSMRLHPPHHVPRNHARHRVKDDLGLLLQVSSN
jgi:hypothetical protein